MQTYLSSDLILQRIGIAMLSALLLAGCSDNAAEPQIVETAAEAAPYSFELLNPELSASAKEIALEYVQQIDTDFKQAGIEIEKFQSSIATLTDQTNIENLNLSKQAWLNAHSAYELTTLHRYYATQLMGEQDSLALMQLQYQINHWPIVPGYIDYVDGYPDSGIVHDINVNLDADSLREQHGSFDVSEVTLGFHAIEFLLWGYDADSVARPATDFDAVLELTPKEIESGYTLEQLSNNRRRLFLTVVADTLVKDFLAVQSLWLAEKPSISQRIESISGTELIVNVNLDADSLRQQHGSFDVSEVTLGFHAIEFLLWGYDADSVARPATDFDAVLELTPKEIESGYTLEQLSNNRRRLFLTVVADTLVKDFLAVQSLWLAEKPSISQRIESISGTELIVILADSMSAMLTQELLQRSLYPMLNGDFVESVQSPYSRSTQNAVSSQLSGLERLLLERQTENGTTLDLVFSAISDEFSEFFYQNFDASKACLVLLYSNREGDSASPTTARETEVVECINLLTIIIDYNDRLKFDLTN